MQRPQIGVVAKDGSEPVNEKYYTSGIQVTIQDMVASNVTTAKKLKYEILDKNGNNVTAEASGGTSGESDVPSTTFDMLNDGIYTIRAKAVDAKGKESATRERQVVIDTANPTIPSLTVNGSKGPNAGDTTYISAISVAITPGTDTTSGVWGIEYDIQGTNKLNKPREIKTNKTYTVTLTQVGTNTVYARTKDNAGHYSEQVNTGELTKVTTSSGSEEQAAGVIAKVTLTTEDSINITANITGKTDQITSYDFQIGTSASNIATIETRTVDINKIDGREMSYTYREITGGTALTANTTYYLNVIARDEWGQEYTLSNVLTATTIFNSYVDPMIPVDQSRTGMTVDYMPEKTAGWAIWGEDDNYLYLISRDTSQKVTLTGFPALTEHLKVLDLAVQEYTSSDYTRNDSKSHKGRRYNTRYIAYSN